ncbi:MAG TPA: type 4a pilus biogenesis protein PilO, partial [Thermodesulfobacteriota bacterium]|nr:type 4a pilus biogenesis protein PilO [Thermodesulfobacteriota bacterium]
MPIELPPAISDRLEQLTFMHKVGLVLLGIIIIAGVAVFSLLAPLWGKTTVLQGDIEREKLKLQQIQRTRDQMAHFKQELAEMNDEYKRLESMLPEKSEMPLLLKAVSDIGQEQGL